MDSYYRRLIKQDALAFYVNQGGGGTEIDTDIVRDSAEDGVKQRRAD